MLNTHTHSRPWDSARRRAGALPGFCWFPGRGTTASGAPERTSGQHFALVPQIELQRLYPHVRTRETPSLVCREPLTSRLRVEAALAVVFLPPTKPSPRASPPWSPRVPSSVPRPGPTSWLAAAPRAPRRSSGALGRAGAARGGGPGRHGPQSPALLSAGPLPAPRARVPAAWPPWASGGRPLPLAAAALSRAAPRPPALSELTRSWRAPGPLPRQRLSQGSADPRAAPVNRTFCRTLPLALFLGGGGVGGGDGGLTLSLLETTEWPAASPPGRKVYSRSALSGALSPCDRCCGVAATLPALSSLQSL